MLRGETPRCKSAWLPGGERPFYGLRRVESRALDISVSQEWQRDWDDDLLLFHPIYI